MKKIKLIFSFVLLLTLAISCSVPDGISDDTELRSGAPGVVSSNVVVANDNSGKVTVTPTSDGASEFTVDFGDGTSSVKVLAGQQAVYYYKKEGNYTIKVTATSLNGENVNKEFPVAVVSRSPVNLNISTSTKVHDVTIKPSADFATSYLVYFGDVVGEVGTSVGIGKEATHTFATAGTYTIKAIALSGGTAPSIEKTTTVTIYDAFKLPIDFEDTKVNYFFGTFGGEQFSIVLNPDAVGLNTSPKVAKFTKGNENWSGTYSPLDQPIDFANGNKIRVLVYNPDPANIGKKLNVELEAAVGGSPANGIGVLKVPFTKSGAWEELIFDFSSIPGFPMTTAKFNQIVFRFDSDTGGGSGATFYIDNIRLTY
jgi:PKD repeat protein